jgi:hypothetical protein
MPNRQKKFNLYEITPNSRRSISLTFNLCCNIGKIDKEKTREAASFLSSKMSPFVLHNLKIVILIPSIEYKSITKKQVSKLCAKFKNNSMNLSSTIDDFLEIGAHISPLREPDFVVAMFDVTKQYRNIVRRIVSIAEQSEIICARLISGRYASQWSPVTSLANGATELWLHCGFTVNTSQDSDFDGYMSACYLAAFPDRPLKSSTWLLGKAKNYADSQNPSRSGLRNPQQCRA